MTIRVVVLKSAEADLKDLKRYVVRDCGKATWLKSYAQIKRDMARIEAYPQAGRIPGELNSLQLTQYRQVLSGTNRIIYEVRGETAFVHVICDTRKDLRTVLMERLLRC